MVDPGMLYLLLEIKTKWEIFEMNNSQELFLEPGDNYTVGYCGAEFQCPPPKNSITDPSYH